MMLAEGRAAHDPMTRRGKDRSIQRGHHRKDRTISKLPTNLLPGGEKHSGFTHAVPTATGEPEGSYLIVS